MYSAPSVNVIDNLTVRDGVSIPDLAGLGAALKTGRRHPRPWKVEGDTITLTGTAPSEDVKAPLSPPPDTAWRTPRSTTRFRSPNAPAPNRCADVQAGINDLLKTPINFATDGYAVADSSQGQLTQIAAKIRTARTRRLRSGIHRQHRQRRDQPAAEREPGESRCGLPGFGASPPATSPRRASDRRILSRAMTRRRARLRTVASRSAVS